MLFVSGLYFLRQPHFALFLSILVVEQVAMDGQRR